MEKQQKIVEMAKDICRYQPCCNDVCNPVSACDALKYAERAVEAGYSKQSGWISVKERLPEDGWSDEDFYPMDCLLAAKVGDRIVVDWGTRGVSLSWHTNKKECYWEILHDWDEGQGCEITHWMPLPEAPKGGTE